MSWTDIFIFFEIGSLLVFYIWFFLFCGMDSKTRYNILLCFFGFKLFYLAVIMIFMFGYNTFNSLNSLNSIHINTLSSFIKALTLS